MMRRLFHAFAVLSFCFLTSAVAGAADKELSGAAPALITDKGGYYLVSSPQGLVMNVYASPSQKLLHTVRFAEFVTDFSGVSAIAVDDANLLAACAVTRKNAPGAIYLFDLQSAKLRGVIAGLPAAPTRVAFSGNGRYLAASVANRQGLLIYKIVHVRKENAMSYLSDQEKDALLKLGYLEKTMLDPALTLRDRSIPAEITAMSFNNRENLVVAADDGSIRLYNDNLKPAKTIKGKNGGKPSCLRFSPDASKLAVGYSDTAAIDIYAASDLTYLYSPDTTSIDKAFSSALVWSTDGRFLYAAFPATQKNETAVYRWRSGGEGWRSRIKSIDSPNSRIAPLLGGGIAYNDSANGINLLDKRYGAVYNEQWLSVWVAAGFKHGDVTYEIGGDYSDSEGDSGSYWFPVSKLKWPINAMMAGFDASVRPFNRLELNGSFFHNVTNNLGSSKVEDSDWVFDPAIYGDTPDIYSESDTDFRGYTGDIQARFWIIDRQYSNTSSFSLGVAAGFAYQHYYWEASNLDQWSPSGVYGADHTYVSGLIGTYKAELFMPYLELAIRSKIGKVDINGTIGGSPYLRVKDEDDHMLRKRLMTTDASGYSVKAGLQANYNINPHWFVGARFNLLYFKARGTQNGLQYATTSEAAAGYRWDIEHEITSFQADSLLLMGFRF